jgi:hypothetical protein
MNLVVDNDPISTLQTQAGVVNTLQLNPNRSYRIRHRGTTITGSADTTGIFVVSGGMVEGYGYGNGVGVMNNGDEIFVSGVHTLGFKAVSGSPCLTITVVAPVGIK